MVQASMDFVSEIVVIGKPGFIPERNVRQKITLENGNWTMLSCHIKKIRRKFPNKRIFVCGAIAQLSTDVDYVELESLNLILVDGGNQPPEYVYSQTSDEVLPFDEFGLEWKPTPLRRVSYLSVAENTFSSFSDAKLKEFRSLDLFTVDNSFWDVDNEGHVILSEPLKFSFAYGRPGEPEVCDLGLDYGETIKPSTIASRDKKLIKFVGNFLDRHDLDESQGEVLIGAIDSAYNEAFAKQTMLVENMRMYSPSAIENTKLFRVFPQDVKEFCGFFDQAAEQAKLYAGRFYKNVESYHILVPLRRSIRAKRKRCPETSLTKGIQSLALGGETAFEDASVMPQPARKRQRISK